MSSQCRKVWKDENARKRTSRDVGGGYDSSCLSADDHENEVQGEIEWQRHKPVSHPERAKVGTAVQPYRLVFSIGQLHAEGEVGWWYVERGSSGSGSPLSALRCIRFLNVEKGPSST